MFAFFKDVTPGRLTIPTLAKGPTSKRIWAAQAELDGYKKDKVLGRYRLGVDLGEVEERKVNVIKIHFTISKSSLKNETNLNVRKERRCRILRRKGTLQCPEIDTEPNPRFHGLGWCTSESSRATNGRIKCPFQSSILATGDPKSKGLGMDQAFRL